jgi:predicted RNA-binding protein YlqC (UPF0109 family)
VEVRSVEGQQVIVLELCVHPEDVGQVIGRHGRTAEALRTIFSAAGMKLHRHVTGGNHRLMLERPFAGVTL